MAGRRQLIDGREYTPQMLKVSGRCWKRHGMRLREWILCWRAENPHAPVADLAADLGIDRGTLYDWMDNLHIARGGVSFIDLDANNTPDSEVIALPSASDLADNLAAALRSAGGGS